MSGNTHGASLLPRVADVFRPRPRKHEFIAVEYCLFLNMGLIGVNPSRRSSTLWQSVPRDASFPR